MQLESMSVGTLSQGSAQDVHAKQSQVRDIGVDDWAYRKGVTYGSIIVSMETGEVIDLLEDREVESFRQWLEEHQEVKLVSRDRCTDYSRTPCSYGEEYYRGG